MRRSISSKITILIVVGAVGLFAVGCGSGTTAAPSSSSTTTTSTVAVSINPSAAATQIGNTVQFTASVVGSTNTSVTWGATAGTISSSGLYTPPNTPGTYQVTAT